MTQKNPQEPQDTLFNETDSYLKSIKDSLEQLKSSLESSKTTSDKNYYPIITKVNKKIIQNIITIINNIDSARKELRAKRDAAMRDVRKNQP